MSTFMRTTINLTDGWYVDTKALTEKHRRQKKRRSAHLSLLLLFVLSNSNSRTLNYFRRRVHSCNDEVVSELSCANSTTAQMTFLWKWCIIFPIIFWFILPSGVAHLFAASFACYCLCSRLPSFLVPVCYREIVAPVVFVSVSVCLSCYPTLTN